MVTSPYEWKIIELENHSYYFIKIQTFVGWTGILFAREFLPAYNSCTNVLFKLPAPSNNQFSNNAKKNVLWQPLVNVKKSILNQHLLNLDGKND